MRDELIELRDDLARDIELSTTRDQYIRAAQRLSKIEHILLLVDTES